MYQISVRRKAGRSPEKVGRPFELHDEAVEAMEALLEQRFPGRWHRSAKASDQWMIDGAFGAKLLECDENGKALPSASVTLNIRVSVETRDALRQIAVDNDLRNSKHKESPNLSAAVELVVTTYQKGKQS